MAPITMNDTHIYQLINQTKKHRRVFFHVATTCMAVLFTLFTPSFAQNKSKESSTIDVVPVVKGVGGYVPGRILVTFRHGVVPNFQKKQDSKGVVSGIASLDALSARYHCVDFKRISVGNVGADIYTLDFAPGTEVEELVQTFNASGLFEIVEPDYLTGIHETTPNDALYSLQWGLKNTGTFSIAAVTATAGADLDMRLAWDLTTGSSSVIVAVIDAGIKLDHPEFTGRIWSNTAEVAANGIDDDGNGLVDDTQGWDFVNNDNNPTDDNGHGQHVSSIIGAKGNNTTLMAGINWNCRIMPLKTQGASGSGSGSSAISALYYAASKGAKVVNMSIGGYGFSSTYQAAVNFAYMHGVTIVASMGNDDTAAVAYPAGYNHVIAVGATRCNDSRAPFSNRGSHISVSAPGDLIVGLDEANNTSAIYMSGTSQAAPHVAGVASLMLSLDPSKNPDQIKAILEETAEDMVGNPAEDIAGFDIYHGHGRINAYQALLYCTTPASITGTATVCVGKTTTLANATTGGTWSSGSTGVATVGSTTGIVTGVAEGTAVITYKKLECYTTQVVTVSPNPGTPAAGPSPVTICLGSSAVVTVNATANNITLLSENWNSGQLGGWTIATNNLGAGVPWQIKASAAGASSSIVGDGTNFIEAVPAFSASNTNTTLTSPVFSTVGYSSATLTYNQYFGSTAGDVQVVVQISTNGGSSWSTLFDQTGSSQVVASWTAATPQKTISLPVGAIGVSTVRLRWLYNSTTGNFWTLDNIAVKGNSGMSYAWTGISGATGLACTPCATNTITPAAAGTNAYSVVATAANGCSSGTMVAVTANALAAIGGASAVCVGASTTFTHSSGGGTWSSSAPTIATVNTSGSVSGVLSGTATITYSVGGCIATKTITVSPLATPGAVSGASTVCVGANTTFTASGTTGGTWFSTATGVATVGTSGIVSGVAAGTATISYTVTNSCGAVAATRIITVSPLATPGTVSGASTVCVGANTPFTASGTTGGTWFSTATGVATVGTSGIVSGVAAGTATISYTVTNSCGAVAATRIITVSPLATPGTVSGASTVCVGANIPFTASGTTGGTWFSTATGVATVGTSGIVSGVAAGTATISYTVTNSCGTVAATRIITVSPLATPGTVSGASTVCVGANTTFTASGTTGGTWFSTATGVATVGTSGIVSGVAAGTATISYTVTNSCGSIAATQVVSVSPLASPGTLSGVTTILVGGTTTLTPTVGGGTWSSGSPAVATVGTSGIVTGVAAGTSVISYGISNSCGTTYATATISVSALSGNGLAFSSSYVNVPPVIAAGGSYTKEAWVFLNSHSGSNNVISASSHPFYIPTFMRAQNSGGGEIIDPNPFPLSTWVHVAVTYDAPTNTMKLYRAGTVVASSSTAGSGHISEQVQLGAYLSSNFFDGKMDEVRIWNVARTATQIADNMNCDVAQQTGLVAYFRFDQGTAGGDNTTITRVTDYSGNGNCGTLNNFTLTGSGSNFVAGTVSGCVPIAMPAPSAITGTGVACVGGSTTLSNAQSGGVWMAGNGNITIGSTSGIVTGVSAGTTVVSYTLNCATVTTVVTVSVPVVGAGSNTTICSGGSTTLTGTGASTYIWSPAAGLSATVGGSVTASPTITTTYTVTGYNAFGCSTTASVTVSVNPLPVAATISGTSSILAGTTTTLSASVGGGVWSSGATGIATVGSSTGTVTGVASGTAVISYGISNSCGTAYGTFNVTVAAPGGNALAFSSSFVGIPAVLSTGGSYTKEAWVYVNDFSNANNIVSGISNPFWIPGQLQAFNTGGVTLTDGVPFPLNVWMHVAVTYEAGTNAMKLYKNGVLVASTTSAGSGHVSEPLQMGAYNSANFLNGKLDEVRVWNIARTASQIADNMNCDVAQQTGLVACYRFDQGTAGGTNTSVDNVTDYSGNNNCGAFNGFTLTGTTSNFVTGVAASCVPVSTATPPAITGTTVVCVGGTSTLANSLTGGLWSASNGNVTIGSTSGIVTGVAAGTTTITYNRLCQTVTTVVTVSVPVVSAGSSTAVCAGNSTVLTASGAATYVWSPATGLSSTAGSSVIATPSSTIIYTVTGYNSFGCSATASATVSVNPLPSAISGTTSVALEGTTTLTATPSGGNWSSSNALIATVGSTTGEVTGIGSGSAIITYMLPTGCFRVTTVNVGLAAISGPASLCVGATAGFSHAVTGGTWSSSNPSVASINSSTGVATGIATGAVIISYNTGFDVQTKAVTVSATTSGITGAGTVCVAGTTMLSHATPGGTWSGGGLFVSIGAGTGVVTGLSQGVTSITYSLPDGCRSIKALTVNPLPTAISGPSDVCVGLTITLTSGTGGVWSSSDAGIVSVPSYPGVVTGVSAGLATVSFTNTTTSCYVVKNIRAVSLPSAISGPSSACPGQLATFSSATSGGIWSSSNVGVANPGTAEGTFTAGSSGTATISYIADGCLATKVLTVVATPAVISGTGTVCAGSSTTLTSSSSGLTWSSTDEDVAIVSTASATTGVVSGVAAGTARISYTNAAGCASTVVVTVTSALPTIAGGPAFCLGGTLALTNSVAGGTWQSSAPAVVSIAASGVVSGISVGTGTITYRTNATCFTTKTLSVTAAPTEAIMGTASVCVNATTTLSHSVSGGSWVSSNGTRATVGSATGLVSGVSAGTVVITYYTAAGCYRTTVVTVNALPASIGGGASAICEGAVTTFTNTTAGGSWISDGSVVTVGSLTGVVTGVASGVGVVSYIVSSTGCTASRQITVNANPAAITGAGQICKAATTTWSSSPAGGTWSSTNTAIASAAATGAGIATITGNGAGTTTLSYTMPGGCRTMKIITVNAVPNPITGTRTMCAGSNTTLTTGPSGMVGVWGSDDGTIATVTDLGSATARVDGMSNGTTTINFTNSAGCVASAVVTVTTSPAAISGPASVCVGGTASLSSATPGGTWASSAATIATVSGAGVVTGASLGMATITYRTGTTCFTTHTISVNTQPADAITGSSAVCIGEVRTLSHPVTGGTWTSSDVYRATVSATGDVTGVSAGAVIITYHVSSGCFRTFNMTVKQYVMPVSGTYTVCPGGTTSLSSASYSGVWTSSTPSVATINSASGLVAALAAGTTTIVYTIPVTGCSASKVVTVHPLPDMITGSSTVCVGRAISLSSTTVGGTWTSSAGIYATVNAASGLVTGVAAGTVNISYANTFGCRTHRNITVNPVPASITGTAVVNELSTTVLSCATTGGTWSSSNTAVGTIDVASGALTGISTGNTTITYTVTSTGCFAIRTATVNPFGSRASFSTSTGIGVKVTIYPSPTAGTLTVDTKTPGILFVNTVEGKQLVVYTITPESATIQLPVNLASGMYVCRFVSEDGNVTIERVVYAP